MPEGQSSFLSLPDFDLSFRFLQIHFNNANILMLPLYRFFTFLLDFCKFFRLLGYLCTAQGCLNSKPNWIVAHNGIRPKY